MLSPNIRRVESYPILLHIQYTVNSGCRSAPVHAMCLYTSTADILLSARLIWCLSARSFSRQSLLPTRMLEHLRLSLLPWIRLKGPTSARCFTSLSRQLLGLLGCWSADSPVQLAEDVSFDCCPFRQPRFYKRPPCLPGEKNDIPSTQ
jgi:hypothetical protein